MARRRARRNPERAKMAQQAVKLHERGKDVFEIADEIGVMPSTVRNYLKDPTGEITRAMNKHIYQLKKSGEASHSSARRAKERDARVKVAKKLAKEGKSLKEISEVVGVTTGTVRHYFKGVDPDHERKVLKLYKYGVYETREEADVAHNRTDLPISDKIRMRPVWKRRQRRIYGQNELPPPTDEEKADAIRILGDQQMQREAPALYFEAFLILDEGSP